MRRVKLYANLALLSSVAITSCDSPTETTDPLRFSGENPSGYSHWESGVALTCKPERMEICSYEGCSPNAPSNPSTITLELDPSANQLRRCIDGRCDRYSPQVSYSGIFTVLTLPDQGAMVKVSSQGQYLEIATQLLDAVVYRGKCRASSSN